MGQSAVARMGGDHMPIHPSETAPILMVDDLPANLLALTGVLEPLGHELVCARSGAEAIRLAVEREFAVILMDAQMPTLDGLQTTRLLKEHPVTCHVPIIFLTAVSLEASHMFRGYESGAVDYIVKPFEPEILRSKVKVFVELFLRREQVRRQTELLHTERVARAEAEAKILAREEILAIVSHDLGNPIAAAAATMESVRRSAQASADGNLLRQSDRVLRALERMHRLVDDLLDASRIETDRLVIDKQRHDVLDIVNQAIDVLLPVAAERSLKLACSAPASALSAFCDRDRIFQVLSNLIGNAIKFSPEDGAIVLTVTVHDTEVELEVRDSGPGICPDDISHIFDRYWQAAGQHRRGLGLGLAIAKGIVQAHGGRIWVESRVGDGSTFHFTLPRAPTAAAS
jgi:signal transduction histidine kinase